jgi:hypothetical protein
VATEKSVLVAAVDAADTMDTLLGHDVGVAVAAGNAPAAIQRRIQIEVRVLRQHKRPRGLVRT